MTDESITLLLKRDRKKLYSPRINPIAFAVRNRSFTAGWRLFRLATITTIWTRQSPLRHLRERWMSHCSSVQFFSSVHSLLFVFTFTFGAFIFVPLYHHSLQKAHADPSFSWSIAAHQVVLVTTSISVCFPFSPQIATRRDRFSFANNTTRPSFKSAYRAGSPEQVMVVTVPRLFFFDTYSASFSRINVYVSRTVQIWASLTDHVSDYHRLRSFLVSRTAYRKCLNAHTSDIDLRLPPQCYNRCALFISYSLLRHRRNTFDSHCSS